MTPFRQWLVKIGFWFGVLLSASTAAAESFETFFERFKDTASDTELHDFLYAMPKGGDLHQHLTGSIFPEWWWQLARRQDAHGIEYFTKTRLNQCQDAGQKVGRLAPYELLYQTIAHHRLEGLSTCEQSEFQPLETLSISQRAAWMNGIWLEHPSEGREAFFETHWQRLGDLTANPWIIAEALVLHLKTFAAEGLVYLEPQVTLMGYRDAEGKVIAPGTVAQVIRARLAQKDVLALDMTVRFQQAILRFLPNAESQLETAYQIVASQPEWVAINLVGREDNQLGQPGRFLETFRSMRRTHPGIKLSIHAGESETPNHNIRDTLLLGADRIGHGLNLLSDPETLRLMRHGPYLVEINLISNLLLEYVATFEAHPFPELLRIGVPVALSTDDRGMWDSSLTDEYFVAVKSFDLNWTEIQQLTRNSLKFSFLESSVQAELLDEYTDRLKVFETGRQAGAGEVKKSILGGPKRGFVCRNYAVCADD